MILNYLNKDVYYDKLKIEIEVKKRKKILTIQKQGYLLRINYK